MKINCNKISYNPKFTAKVSPYLKEITYNYCINTQNKELKNKLAEKFEKLKDFGTDDITINYRKVRSLLKSGEEISYFIYLNNKKNLENGYKLLVKENTLKKTIQTFLDLSI